MLLRVIATAADPSPTPLILEVALAVAVFVVLGVRGHAVRAFDAARRRLSALRPVRRTAARARAR